MSYDSEAEVDDSAKRIEEVVASIMRQTRDEKIRLDAMVMGQTQLIAALRDEVAALTESNRKHFQRVTQLETDLTAMVTILNAALYPRRQAEPVDDGEPAPPFLFRGRKVAE